jgi:hypothetical protein
MSKIITGIWDKKRALENETRGNVLADLKEQQTAR